MGFSWAYNRIRKEPWRWLLAWELQLPEPAAPELFPRFVVKVSAVRFRTCLQLTGSGKSGWRKDQKGRVTVKGLKQRWVEQRGLALCTGLGNPPLISFMPGIPNLLSKLQGRNHAYLRAR